MERSDTYAHNGQDIRVTLHLVEGHDLPMIKPDTLFVSHFGDNNGYNIIAIDNNHARLLTKTAFIMDTEFDDAFDEEIDFCVVDHNPSVPEVFQYGNDEALSVWRQVDISRLENGSLESYIVIEKDDVPTMVFRMVDVSEFADEGLDTIGVDSLDLLDE
jgi:hypothetical protein